MAFLPIFQPKGEMRRTHPAFWLKAPSSLMAHPMPHMAVSSMCRFRPASATCEGIKRRQREE